MEGKSPTPISPTPQSPNQTSDSEDVTTTGGEYQQAQNPPQMPENPENPETDSLNQPFQQQSLTLGQDLLEENKTLYFASLPFDVTEEQLSEFINKVAPVQNVRIMRRPDGTPRGKALCDFATVADAEKVKNECNNALFNGRTITIHFSSNNRRPPPPRFRARPRRRFTSYRDLDAPDDDNEPRRSYDLAPDEQPEPRNQQNDTRNRGNYYHRDRRQYGRRPYHRPYDQPMGDMPGGGRIQDYRTQRNNPPPTTQGPETTQGAPQPPMPF